MLRKLLNRLVVASWLSCSVAAAAPVPASEAPDRTEPLPKRLVGIDVVEHLDAPLPVDLAFTNQRGEPVRLKDFFDGKRPVVVTLNYSNCPMLCSMQLHGFVQGLRKLDFNVGEEFRVVTVSLDPTETAELAKKTQARYFAQYGREIPAKGWDFLTGSDANVHALAEAIGFKYAYNEARKEYIHPAAITLATPSAKIARYLYGLEYDPKTLRLGLVEASEGKSGTTLDRLILFCFHYDATEGRYAPVARNIMQLGGGATVVLLLSFVASLRLRERYRNLESTAQ